MIGDRARDASFYIFGNSDTIPPMDSENTYKAKVYYSNCNLKNEIDIQKGKKVEETACPNCGTTELSKDTNVDLGRGTSFFGNGFEL